MSDALIPRRQPPLSLRLTFAERALLEKKAGSQSLSSFIKNELFGGTGPAPGLGFGVTSRRVGSKERLLAQILAKLGESELGPSMNELAAAAKTGSLYVTDLVEGQLVQACADIAEIRVLLLEALGKRRPAPLPRPKNTTEAFNLAASGQIRPRVVEHQP
ncbi:MAG: hypothetical protein BGO82_11165 [Devosia sp. 67-54]|uniref:hypothetical protein n=1 Tax=unclassified Devosia TaxID=196773 RepID=UPI000960024B|nr:MULTISPECIES: hypothetical protein [unclassified Devosia]MBN9304800.1 hypothetical protein [Devosia sp.]OJX15239.1 MAG: hypothetical protein BGO82_11165 [Devosia sp. 67-54]